VLALITMGNGWLSVRDEMDTTVSIKMLVVFDEPTVMCEM